MAYQQIPGGGLWVPNDFFGLAEPPSTSNATAIAATGDAFAWVGRVWFKERAGAKNIQTVGFHFGSSGITKTGGSGLTLSLQDINLTAGPPMQPDGVKDQTVAIAASNPNFGPNFWLQTANLSATRTVGFGDLLAVVIEYDTNGRLGSDAFTIAGLVPAATTLGRFQGLGVTRISSVYSAFVSVPDVALGFDDGTVGTLYGGFPASAFGSHAYNNTTAVANEYAIGIQFPFPVKISGVLLQLIVVAGADCSVILYSGTTPLQTVAIHANTVAAVGAGNNRVAYVPLPETTLAANTLYYVSVRPDTGNSIQIAYTDVFAAPHFQARGGGMAFCEYNRLNSGAWTAVPTRQPFIGVELSALDDGASGGGGRGGAALSRVRTGY